MPMFTISQESSLNMLANLIHERTGLLYDSKQMDLLADRLAPLMTEGSFENFIDYYYFLKFDSQAAEEWLRVQNALAVNETYFWREFDQIRAVVEVIVPRLQRERPGLPVRIWHAASASGEEPYTMAIALNEAGCYDRGPIEILATDFNTAALAQSQEAVYRWRSFRTLPPEILTRYFIPQPSEKHRLVESIRNRVRFAYLNLVDEAAMSTMHGYDVIVCRNAFIYFSKEVIQRTVDRFYDSLNPEGYLFLAAVESLLRLSNAFELVEIGQAFGYQKRSNLPEAPNEKGSPITSSSTARNDPPASLAGQSRGLVRKRSGADSSSSPNLTGRQEQGSKKSFGGL